MGKAHSGVPRKGSSRSCGVVGEEGKINPNVCSEDGNARTGDFKGREKQDSVQPSIGLPR